MKEAKNANLEREIFSREIASFMLKYNKHFKMLILFILNISQSFARLQLPPYIKYILFFYSIYSLVSNTKLLLRGVF